MTDESASGTEAQTIARAGHSRASSRAVAALVALSLIWGYNWVIMKEAMRYSGPFDFAALRTVFGAFALFAVLVLLRKPLRPPPLGGVALLGLTQTAGFTGLSQWTLVAGGAGKTAVLAYTMPFWVLLFAWPLLGERIRGPQWLAVVLALTGLLLVLEPWNFGGTPASGLLAVASGVVWASGAIVVKKLMQRERFDLLSLTAWQMLYGAAALTALALLVPSGPVEFSGHFIAILAYITLAGTALAWLLWVYVLKYLPVGSAGLGILAVPVVGVLAAWLQLGERPGPWESAGMLAIGAALAILSLGPARRQRNVPPAMGQE